MKTFLPHLKKLDRGFTLVELMIVVAIIAVLSVIGVTIFSGIQKDSRDARRRADIDSIASAMEANYGKPPTPAGQYNALATTYFAENKVPADPTATNVAADNACPGVCKYCVLQGAAQQTARNCAIADTAVGAAQPTGGATNLYWMVCTNLEKASGGVTYFCRGNQQ